MGERGHFNENEGQKQDPLADASAWMINNAILPFVETLSEPYNSFVAPAVESVAKNVFGSDANLHVDIGKAAEPEMLSAGWAATNVSKAIALTGIYAVAERIASKPLRLAGLGVHCLGDMAKARSLPLAALITKGLEKGLLSKSTSLVVGASSYDGLRNERPGETHAGNFWGTATGFTMFEAGNKYAKLSGGSLRNIASYGLKRAAVGVVGGMSQVGISKVIAGGETSSAELAGSAIVGGTINTLFGLPAVGRRLKLTEKSSESANLKASNVVEGKDAVTESPKTQESGSLSQRISTLGAEKVIVEVALPERAPFADYGDFLYRGLSGKNVEMDVYKIEGHPDVRVLASKSDLADLSSRQIASTANAGGVNMTTMEMMAKVLDQSPDSSFARRIVISGREAADTHWLKQDGLIGADEKIHGEYIYRSAIKDYEMRMYEPMNFDQMLKTYMHEWVHIAEKRFKSVFDMTKLANELEGNRGFEHEGCSAMQQYSSSVLLGDHILSAHPILAMDTISKAPIQSLTALQCLAKILPTTVTNPTITQCRSMIASIKQNVMPEVVEKLNEQAASGSENSDIARKLADFLND